jgi:hypothetical protein
LAYFRIEHKLAKMKIEDDKSSKDKELQKQAGKI